MTNLLRKPVPTVILVSLVCMGFFWNSSRRDESPQLLRQLRRVGSKLDSDAKSVMFFNRVPKCGSEMIVLLLQWLQAVNNFRHIRLPGNDVRRLNYLEQKELAKKVETLVNENDISLSLDRHVYFTNVTAFRNVTPIFINLVRDPIEKLLSRFYYSRVTPNPLNPDIKFAPQFRDQTVKPFNNFEECFYYGDPECKLETGKSYDLTIPYFCGHEELCMVLNNKWALAKAKANIEESYLVVGVLEELNMTLSVLENKVPTYFHGVQDMYFNDLLQPHKNLNKNNPRKLMSKVRKQLKNVLWAEYDLFYWILSRLRSQYETIR